MNRWIMFCMYVLMVIPALGVADSPLLLFQIECGFQDELIYRYRNDEVRLKRGLENIVRALEPLTEEYEVAVLIAPVGLYDRHAYGKEEAQPLDCLHPGLQRAMEYFEQRPPSNRIGVFLDLISSDNWTKQNGWIYRYAPAPLRNLPQAEGVPGLALDLDTLAAAKQRFPNALIGIRFHETHYERDLQGAIVNQNGFDLDADVVHAIVDFCRDHSLLLQWNNSVWLSNDTHDYDRNHLPYVNNEHYLPLVEEPHYKAMQDYAAGQLGKNLILTIANNTYHPAPHLPLLTEKAGPPLPLWLVFDLPFETHPLKSYAGAAWGLSNQAWFWSELMNTVGGRYYSSNEMACPVEILMAYSLQAIKQQAALIQYEPSWYFFRNGFLEDDPDGSERLEIRRLRMALLQLEHPRNPPADPLFYFDRNLQKLLENRRGNRPLTYAQDSLLIWSGNEFHWFDFFIGKRLWDRRRSDEIPTAFQHSPPIFATRLSLRGNSDDALVLIQEDGQKRLRFYEPSGRFLNEDRFLLLDNAHGAVGAVAAGNFIPRVFQEGDGDELAVVRLKSPTEEMVVELHTLTFFQSDRNFKFNPQRVITLPIKAMAFRGMVGIRSTMADSAAAISPLDRLVILSAEESGELMLRLFDGEGVEHASLPLDAMGAGRIPCTVLDVFGNGREEIVLWRHRSSGEEYLDVYQATQNSLMWIYSIQIAASDRESAKSAWQMH